MNVFENFFSLFGKIFSKNGPHEGPHKNGGLDPRFPIASQNFGGVAPRIRTAKTAAERPLGNLLSECCALPSACRLRERRGT